MSRHTPFVVDAVIGSFLKLRIADATDATVFLGGLLPVKTALAGVVVPAAAYFVQATFGDPPEPKIFGGSSVGQTTLLRYQVLVTGAVNARRATRDRAQEVIKELHFPARAIRPDRVVRMSIDDSIPVHLPLAADARHIFSVAGSLLVTDNTEPA